MAGILAGWSAVCTVQTAEGAGRVDVASVRFGVRWSPPARCSVELFREDRNLTFVHRTTIMSFAREQVLQRASVLCTLWFLIAVSSRKTLHQYTDRSSIQVLNQPVWHTNYS